MRPNVPMHRKTSNKKIHRRGACHKAGFTYRNLVGRWLAAAENKRYMQRKRREITPRPTTKGVRTILFVLLFKRLALQGMVYYTF